MRFYCMIKTIIFIDQAQIRQKCSNFSLNFMYAAQIQVAMSSTVLGVTGARVGLRGKRMSFGCNIPCSCHHVVYMWESITAKASC